MIGTFLSGAAVVAVVLAMLKAFIELKVKPDSSIHDSLIQTLAVVFGIIGALVYGYTTSVHVTGQVLWDWLGQGFGYGLGAIVFYHVVSAKASDIFGAIGGSTTTTTTTVTPTITVTPSQPAEITSVTVQPVQQSETRIVN